MFRRLKGGGVGYKTRRRRRIHVPCSLAYQTPHCRSYKIVLCYLVLMLFCAIILCYFGLFLLHELGLISGRLYIIVINCYSFDYHQHSRCTEPLAVKLLIRNEPVN